MYDAVRSFHIGQVVAANAAPKFNSIAEYSGDMLQGSMFLLTESTNEGVHGPVRCVGLFSSFGSLWLAVRGFPAQSLIIGFISAND